MSQPILDPGSPESFGGYETARELASWLNVPFSPEPVAETRRAHGFGPEGQGGGKTTHIWYLKLPDLNDRRVSLCFDLIEGSAPLLVGLDYDQHASTDDGLWVYNRKSSSGTKTAHPFATALRRDRGGSLRRFLDIRPTATTLCFLSREKPSSASALSRPEILARKLHAYSHAPLDALRQLTRKGKVWTPDLDKHLVEVTARCATCPGTGSNAKTGYRKVSLNKFGKDVNEAVQVDHADLTCSQTPKLVSAKALVILCERSRYSESPIVAGTSMDCAIDAFTKAWLFSHGAPSCISGDPAFSNKPFRKFCETHSIRFVPKPARRHNSQGLVERRIGVLKGILERLVSANDSLHITRRQSPDALIAKANFLSNISSHRHFSPAKNVSAFELFRGRSPSFLGLQASVVSPDLIAAFDQLQIKQAADKLVHSRNLSPYVRKPDVKPKDIVYAHVQRRPGSGRDAIGWSRHEVVETTEDSVTTKPEGSTGPRARNHTLAWDDVRPIPKHPLSQEILEADLAPEAPPIADDDTSRQPDAGPSEALLGCARRDVPFDRPTTPLYTSLKEAEDDYSSENYWCKQILEAGLVGTLTKAQLAPIVPNWLLEQALQKELEGWEGAVEVGNAKNFRERYGRRLQIIGSHVIFKIKSQQVDDELIQYSLKARIVLHGNREPGKDDLRADARSSSFTVIRVILSLAAILGFELAHLDATAAYLQSGECPRLLFVKPPAGWIEVVGEVSSLWRLLKLPYGLRDAGRQWYLALEHWLRDLGFTQLDGLPELFILESGGSILCLIGRVVDDLLVAGITEHVKSFLNAASKRWKLGTCQISTDFQFNGARIRRTQKGIELDMKEYVEEKIERHLRGELKLTRSRRMQAQERLTDAEAALMRSIAGTLLFMGAVSPHAQFAASIILQKLPFMTIEGMGQCLNIISAIAKGPNTILFPNISDSCISDICLVGFSDASLNLLGGQVYGQGASLIGLQITLQVDNVEKTCFYFLESSSSRLKRVVHSSFGAEILAAADAESKLHALREALSAVIPNLRSTLFIDSKGLFECLTTLSDRTEYRLKKTVARLRESFESGDTDNMQWIPGISNYADPGTKHNPVQWTRLWHALSSGSITIPTSSTRGQAWRDRPF